MLVRGGCGVEFHTLIGTKFIVVNESELRGRYLELSHIRIITHPIKKGKGIPQNIAIFLDLTAIFPLKKKETWYIMIIVLICVIAS